MPIYMSNGAFKASTPAHPDKIFLNDEMHEVGGITADQFRAIASVIRQEGVSDAADEYRYIAYATCNEAKALKKTMYQVAMSPFSSVPDKKPLADADNSAHACFARAAVLEVLTSTVDPTNGARRWDGTDFIAWGLHSPYGKSHAKFREYKHISIPKDIYDEFVSNNLKKYTSGHVSYSHTPFAIPATVFTDPKNVVDGAFNCNTGAPVKQGLVAVAAKGLTIFWKIVDA